MPPAVIELDDVAVAYGTVCALAPTSLAVRRGETLALIGPSGSGKSTMVRTMAGLAPAEGVVRFAGAAISDWRQVRLRLGYVVQEGGLFPHLSAYGNVTLMAHELGWDRPRVDARVAELAALAGLDDRQLARYPAELSGGQRQRVALMRALMLDPEVLLLDEPLSALDPITRARLAAELKAIFTQLGKTVVLVTHSLREARFLAARIVLMNGGRVIQDGAFEVLETAPANPFVAEFIAAEQAL
jgi:osmoprotectant transport system ATP-binding protein